MSNELLAVVIVAVYGLLCGLIYWHYHRRNGAVDTPDADIVIAYGSQSGRSETLAHELAARIQQQTVALMTLNQLTKIDVTSLQKLVVITSTYGEGQAPDNATQALPFFKKRKSDSFVGLQVAVLGLGDKNYARYCGFARDLTQAFSRAGMKEVLPLATMEQVDDELWATWQTQLADTWRLTLGAAVRSHIFNEWQLLHRHWVNEGSQGGPVYQLDLACEGAIAREAWQAGDIAEVRPGNALGLIEAAIVDRKEDVARIQNALAQVNLRKLTLEARRRLNSDERLEDEWLAQLPVLSTRYYSIASVPREQTLKLLVRQQRSASGELGLGSGWLTEHLALNGNVSVHIRTNNNFHPAPVKAPIILVGNGTGIAGLRAHLAQRALDHRLSTGTVPAAAWLLFGERNRAKDRHFAADLEKWQAMGVLEKISLAFSRDVDVHRYVQDLIAPNAAMLREWVARGAYIYVCGSLNGMASGVDRELERALGANNMQKLREQNRYRRDVY